MNLFNSTLLELFNSSVENLFNSNISESSNTYLFCDNSFYCLLKNKCIESVKVQDVYVPSITACNSKIS